ncbi:OTU domain-containing protein 5 [Lemmus lemmus]
MDCLMRDADYFSNCVTGGFTTSIIQNRKNNCHGKHIEMQAMTEMYNSPVEVYQYSIGTSVVEPTNTFHVVYQNEDEPIRVNYPWNLNYNSVVNPNKVTIGQAIKLRIKVLSPETVLAPAKPPSLCTPGTRHQFWARADWTTSPLVSLCPALE